jgi:hypothetical protein
MDEETIEKSPGFENLKTDISSFIAAVTAYARQSLSTLQLDSTGS